LNNNEAPAFINTDELPEAKLNSNVLDSIAYVNVKKQCDNLTKSNDRDILNYGYRDADLLREQIEMINPDVIFCSSTTFKVYNHLYPADINSVNHICHKHHNRLVLNFYHPSYFQIRGGRETLFNILNSALTENGSILSQFDWYNYQNQKA
jgi:hypothetical protein